MKNVNTAPMEVMSPKANGPWTTEPHEAGWADEAIAMIYVREVAGPTPRLMLRPQISADGVRWMDYSDAVLVIEKPGAYHLDLARFGNWLRLEGHLRGGPADGSMAMLLDFYWVLKG